MGIDTSVYFTSETLDPVCHFYVLILPSEFNKQFSLFFSYKKDQAAQIQIIKAM